MEKINNYLHKKCSKKEENKLIKISYDDELQ